MLCSVYAKICKDAKVGESLEMKLMYREKDSMTVKQVLDGEKLDSLDSKIIVISNEEVTTDLEYSSRSVITEHMNCRTEVYCSIFLKVYKIVERELSELREQHEDEAQNPEVCFVEEAIRYATIRQRNCSLLIAENGVPSKTDKGSALDFDAKVKPQYQFLVSFIYSSERGNPY
jgi:hypothetical protein